MFKLLVINIIVGSLYSLLLSPIIYGLADFFYLGLVEQFIAGLFFSLPLMMIMWIETEKINNKSILFLGGPILSVSATFTFYFMAYQMAFSLDKETPYLLLAYILFFFLLQLFMYDANRQNKA